MSLHSLSNAVSGFLQKNINVVSYVKHGIWFYELELNQWGEKRMALLDKENFKKLLAVVFEKNGPLVFRIQYGSYVDDLELPSWAIFSLRRKFLDLYKTFCLKDFKREEVIDDTSLDFSVKPQDVMSLDFCK